ncbi:MAG: PTS transporter subunit EIIC [Faecalibacterium sp.]
MFLKSKKKNVKQVAGPASITALIGGVTEPAIYGILLKYKKPLIMVCIANAVGGAICGAFNVTRNVQMSVNLLTLPAIWAVYGPWAIVAIAVVCVLVFALVWLFGYKDEMDNVPEKESK